MILRRLGAEDLQGETLDVLAEKIRSYYSNSTTMISLNIEVIKANWTGFLKAGVACIFTVEEEWEVVGIISGLSYPDPLSGKKISQEVFWYVDERFRHRGYGEILIRQFEDWSRTMGATSMRLAHLVDLRAKENQSLYEGLGCKMVEITYEKEL